MHQPVEKKFEENCATEKLEMQVQMTVIDNLGIKMYSNIVPVISELVANAYDADSTIVEIDLPIGKIDEDSIIIVKDNGVGMTFENLNQKYLTVGRNRRDEPESSVSEMFHRKVMGRKGIGKLSAFGIAQKIQIKTCRDLKQIKFEMDLEKIKSTPAGENYSPDHEKIASSCKDGTEINLNKLSRKNRIDIESFRKKLARRFCCITEDFKILVNGTELSSEDRCVRENCTVVENINEIIHDEDDFKVTGWIGTMKDAVSTDVNPGVVIMVRGKLVQEPFFFEAPSQGWLNFAKSRIVGEIHANFLDEEEDLILSNRCSIYWDHEICQLLMTWGRDKIVKLAAKYGKHRQEENEKVVRENDEFKDWLTGLSRPEKKVASKVIKIITSDNNLDEGRILELASFMKESFEMQSFKELVASIDAEETPSNLQLIELFEEWDMIEAREVCRIAKGRLSAIEKLTRLVDTNAKEVPEMHNFLAKYPWILDPSWTITYDEVRFSQLLRDNFSDQELDENDRRIDFVCLGAGDTVHVVELKRPGHSINTKDLDQLLSYVTFIKTKLGNDPNCRSYNSVSGYLVGGKTIRTADFEARKRMWENDRLYVRLYEDLLVVARKLHEDFASKTIISKK